MRDESRKVSQIREVWGRVGASSKIMHLVQNFHNNFKLFLLNNELLSIKIIFIVVYLLKTMGVNNF